MVQVVTVTQQQDTLRPLRNFVSLLAGATSDQTYAEFDTWAGNVPGQFVTLNPNGQSAREGQPVYVNAVANSQGAQLRLSQPAMWIAVAALAYMALK